MSYDKPFRQEYYYLPFAPYGGTTASKTIIGPRGKKGTVRDIIFMPAVADMVGTTTVPEITVGAAAGTTEYARFRLGTAAGVGYTFASGPRRARSLTAGGPHPGGTPPVLNDYPGHVALETAQIPANTAFVITGKAGVGGTPAGQFEAYVLIDWD